MTKLYIATENSDRTEGRGVLVVTGIYSVPEDALSAVRGRGVMGVGDGEVYEIPFEQGRHKGRLIRSEFLYYGYHKFADGTWDYGLTDLAK